MVTFGMAYPEIIAPKPSPIKGLVILLPIKTPAEMPFLRLRTAINAVVNSGNAEAIPNKRTPK